MRITSMKRPLKNLTILSIILSLCSATIVEAHEGHNHFDPKKAAANAAAQMASSVNRLIRTLTPEQKAKAMIPLKDAKREKWAFVPDKFVDGGRLGLPMKEMNAQQQILTHAIPAAALSNRGYIQAMSVMALEKILHDMENKNPIRDSELYYITIFGKPDPKGTWGWRFEGHHMSIHVTVVDGHKFSVTPSFIGTNPAKLKDGPWKGVEVLDWEEQAALRLVNSLDDDQFDKALIKLDAPLMRDGKKLNPVKEILTHQESSADRNLFKFRGIGWSDLKEDQQKFLLRLTNLYFNRFQQQVLKGTRYKGSFKDGSKLSFAWIGGKKRGEQHYYRIMTDQFVIEFVNAQNNANHVHAVWREFDGDFGKDLLGEHFKNHHK